MRKNDRMATVAVLFLFSLMTSLTYSASADSADCCSQPAESGALRIMPLGDSITAGYTDNPKWQYPFEFGYRSRLYELLTGAGYPFQFVGGSEEPWNGRFGTPANQPIVDLRELGVDRHRGYGGKSIKAINKKITQWIEEDRPDMILLMIGINGISVDSPSQLDTLVGQIFAANAKVKLIVAQITPRSSYIEELYDYNTYIKDSLVPAYKNKGMQISTIDLYQHFLTDPNDPKSIDPELFSNRINHPTNAIYRKMAESWFAGIERVLDQLK